MASRSAMLVLMCAGGAAAQYQDLATDRFGGKAAFSTVLSVKGVERNDSRKLMEVDVLANVRTLREERAVINPGDRAPWNFPNLTRPEYSADGTRLAYTGERWCIGGSGCVGVELLAGRVIWLDGSREASGSGRARISANGRWAVYANPTSLANPYRFYRTDLETGWSEFGRTGWSGAPPTSARAVGNDGTAVMAVGRTLTVRKPGVEDVTKELPFNAAWITISADARLAVAQTSDSVPMLWLVDLLTLESIPILVAAEGVAQPALSGDGLTLLFLSGANWAGRNDSLAVQVWTMDLVSGRLRQWSSEAAGVAEATISGDGLVVWCVSRDGRLVRIDGLSGEVRTMVGAAAVLEGVDSVVWAAGSRYRLAGRGLKGAKVRWQGMELSVVQSEDSWIEFVVGWGVEIGAGKLEVEGAESPFQAFQVAGEMKRVAAEFLKTEEFIHGVRADGSALGVANPAEAGEMVTLKLRGLGPCDAEGRTLSRFELTWDSSVPVQVEDSRMDAGEVGIYSVRIRVPLSASGPMLVSVKEAGAEYGDDLGWIAVGGGG